MPTLKAKVGGVWVPVGGGSGGGAEEVEIGPSAPTDASIELWVDSDAIPPAAVPPYGLHASRPAAPYPGFHYYATDTKRDWLWDGTAWQLVGGSMPRVRAIKNTVQATTTGPTIVTWPDGELYDTDSLHSPSTNPSRIIANVAGRWLFDYMIYIQPAASGFEMFMMVNNGAGDGGVRYGWLKQQSDPSGDVAMAGSAMIMLNVGDYVEVTGYAGVVRNMCTPGLPGYFTGSYLGPS